MKLISQQAHYTLHKGGTKHTVTVCNQVTLTAMLTSPLADTIAHERWPLHAHTGTVGRPYQNLKDYPPCTPVHNAACMAKTTTKTNKQLNKEIKTRNDKNKEEIQI